MALVDGLFSREVAAEKASEIDAELDSLAEDLELLDAGIAPTVIPAEDGEEAYDPFRVWEWADPKMLRASLDEDQVRRINAGLRAMWRYVQLDSEMQPIGVEWR